VEVKKDDGGGDGGVGGRR